MSLIKIQTNKGETMEGQKVINLEEGKKGDKKKLEESGT